MKIGVTFPQDYVAFLQRADGGDGFVGSNYIILRPASKNFCREWLSLDDAASSHGLTSDEKV